MSDLGRDLTVLSTRMDAGFRTLSESVQLLGEKSDDLKAALAESTKSYNEKLADRPYLERRFIG